MKRSKGEVRGKARDAVQVRFEAQQLTSFSGLIIFQRLFAKLGLKERLRRCFRHLRGSEICPHHVIVMMVIVHLRLGFRELRNARYYHDDEMVKRLLGLKHLPEVSTVSRALASADERSVENLRAENRHLVLKRLGELGLARVTMDFDGSVQSTGRHAEGTAVGFNKKKKRSRSYYPLFGTIAQTGQALDVHHRPGNVHDSNGAQYFVEQCIGEVRETLLVPIPASGATPCSPTDPSPAPRPEPPEPLPSRHSRSPSNTAMAVPPPGFLSFSHTAVPTLNETSPARRSAREPSGS